ncbi:protein phosphatase 2C domain-containing protein [Roseobacter sp.]|uniref:PP2C family protein-serine/threonine phosphatase n=1 Tax=Roseobacter sp. TaxID=1907202 RepID=UPI003298B4C1
MTQTMMRRFSARTHIGLIRPVNEDAIFAMPDLGLWAVADGMGGHGGGDFASQSVVDALAALPADPSPDTLPARLRAALGQAHAEIQCEAARRGKRTMGSTVVVLVLAGAHFLCLWSGDSRLYRLRDGRLDQITQDHSVVAALVSAGQLTQEAAADHPQSNQITQAVGVGPVPGIEKRRGAVARGDRFLLCSDGLTRYASDKVLARVMRETPIATLADALLHIALDGGAADNVSVIVVEV